MSTVPTRVYRLTIRSEGVAGERHIDVDREVALIGRRLGADVPLPHADVAGVHLRLERQGGAVTLVDAMAGRTEVNGQTVARGGRRLLVDGDEIGVARFRLTYLARSPASTPTGAAGTTALARAMVADVLASLPDGHDTAPWLEIVASPSAGLRRVELPAPGRPLVVGRGETCDLRLLDQDLSREHLRISRGLAGTQVAELGSKNGTRKNRITLPVGQEHSLADGDELRLGHCVLVYRDPTDAYLRELAGREPERRPARPARWPVALGVLLIVVVVWLATR